MFRFQKKYFFITVLLFFTEIAIAVYMHDGIIRPYIGDVLVVILIYCFIRSFLNTPILSTTIAVLLFSYSIEILQYFKLVKLLGLQKSNLANIVMGNSFQWIDFIAYTAGAVIVIWFERKKLSKENTV